MRCHTSFLALHRCVTPIGTVDEYFLARLILLFNVQWNTFNKQVPQVVA